MHERATSCAHPLTAAVPVAPVLTEPALKRRQRRWWHRLVGVASYPSMPFSNLALWDRLLRVALGVAAVSLGWTLELHEVLGLALRILGWVPLVTGLLGWSPLYSLLNITTRRSSTPRHP